MAYVEASHVAIGASATACFEGLQRLLSWGHLELKPKATWPLFQELKGPWPGASGEDWTLYTDIGGESICTRDMTERGILDCSHSWRPVVSG